jgi:hypothetical protein
VEGFGISNAASTVLVVVEKWSSINWSPSPYCNFLVWYFYLNFHIFISTSVKFLE